jgi:hypothetical protein
LDVAAGTGGQLSNDGPSFLYFGTIDANVVGTGSWSVGLPNSTLHFGGAVAATQTINLGGNAALTVGDPTDFQALVNLGVATSVTLDGVHGDAFTYQQDMLRITSNGTLVDTLHLHASAGTSFTIADQPSGTVIYGIRQPQVQSGVIAHVVT